MRHIKSRTYKTQFNSNAFLFLFRILVLIWHLTAVPYSLYRKINEYENKPSYSNGVEYQMTIVPQDPGWQV